MNADSAYSLIAGTCGGVAVVLVGHPFDTVKVRMQTASTKLSLRGAVTSIFAEGGLGGFYAGCGSPLVGQMWFRSFLFLFHHEAKKFTSGTLQMSGTAQSVASGMIAGGGAALAESPVDFFKTQRQVPKTRENVFSLAKSLVGQYGWRVAYQGLSATLIRNVPANGIYFSVFEGVRAHRGSTDLLTTFVAGGLGGLGYWTATFPLDVVKSAMQCQHPGAKKYSGWLDCAGALYREGGAARFTRGIAPCLLRAMPANAVMLTVVDRVKQTLKEQDVFGTRR